jgi:hypothetical protein
MDSGAAVAGMDSSTAGGRAAGALVPAEAQADVNKTATMLRVKKKKRGFIIFLLFILINDSVLFHLLTQSHQILRREIRHVQKQSLYFDGCEILRYTGLVS